MIRMPSLESSVILGNSQSHAIFPLFGHANSNITESFNHVFITPKRVSKPLAYHCISYQGLCIIRDQNNAQY